VAVTGRVPLLARLEQAGGSRPVVQRVAAIVAGLIVIGGLIALNELMFRALLGSDYLRWYLENGALIGVAFGLVTVAWGDLNKLTGLISAHPLVYVATCVLLWTLPGFGLAALIRPDPMAPLWRKREESTRDLYLQLEALEASGVSLPGELGETLARIRKETGEIVARDEARPRPEKGLGIVDVILAMLFVLAFVIVYLAWALVVAPVQYVVNLAAGAPARMALASSYRAWAHITPHEIHIEEAEKSESVPDDGSESGFSAKPVTFTTAVAAALLFTVSYFTG